jgi:hypothetical protein
MTTDASDRRRVGLHLCLDLSCQEKVNSRAGLSGENTRLLSRRLTTKMMEFAKRYLF